MALNVVCPHCQHKMQVADTVVGQTFHCAQCQAKLICLADWAVADADVDELSLQPLEPSEHLNSRREVKPRGRSNRPAWHMPAHRKGKMKRLF